MLKEKDLKQTMKIVEGRLTDGTAENPIRDMSFLTECYKERGEWDKASSISRQMLLVAAGHTETKFEITPLDVDLLIDKTWRGRQQFREIFRLTIFCLIAEILIFGLYSMHQQHPQWSTYARAAICPWDVSAILDRADLESRSLDWDKAEHDCQTALQISPGNKRACRLEAQIATCRGDLDGALRIINQIDVRDELTLKAKAWILFRRGDYEKSARLPFEVKEQGLMRPESMDAHNSALAFALSNLPGEALYASQQEITWAGSDYDRCQGHIDQARYLLPLGLTGQALREADKALSISKDKTWIWLTSEAYLYRGEAKLKLMNYQGALDDANRSLAKALHCARQFRLRNNALLKLDRLPADSPALRECTVFETQLLDNL